MKKQLFHSILLLSLLFSITLSLIFPLACKQNAVPAFWQNLRQDEDWLKSVNQYLSLSYIERQDKAGFTLLNQRNLAPVLYSTYYIMKILESNGTEIKNKNQIAEYVNSLLDEKGAFHDPLWNSTKFITDETRRATSILAYLEIPPQNIDLTLDYLFSLQYGDGTFLLDAEEGMSSLEDTTLRRISYGTYQVVSSLIMLGQSNIIPEETVDTIVTEITDVLSEGNVFSEPYSGKAASIISAIELLARIDPELVTDKAREFITNQLEVIADMPADPFLSSAKANKLLNIAQALQLPSGQDENILSRLRSYLKDDIFPMQNLTGGFGPSDTIEPMTTAENVILANRLGIEYPNLNRLLMELDKHWVGNGWTVFTIPSIDKDNYQISYYALEIANFSGFTGFNRDKLENFLEECFTSSTVGVESVSLKNVYYAVMALKALNSKLTKEQAQSAKEICLSLSKKLVTAHDSDITSDFAYAVLTCRFSG